MMKNDYCKYFAFIQVGVQQRKNVYTCPQMFQTISVYDISILGVWQGNHGRFPNITCAMHCRPLSETHQLL